MSLSCFFYNICFPSLVFFFSVGPAVCLFNFIYCIQPSTQNHQRQGKCSNITSPTPLCYSCTSKQRMIMLWLCKKKQNRDKFILIWKVEKFFVWEHTDTLWVCGWTSVLILCGTVTVTYLSPQNSHSLLTSGIKNTFLPRELDFCSFPDRPR